MENAASTLEEAWERMSWRVEAGRFALVGGGAPPGAALLAALAEPWQLVREGGETTVLCPESCLDAVEAAAGDVRVERGLLWVRFEAPMGWEVVGFLARVTTALAEAGVPLGAVCGYSRDHLFVAERHDAATRAVLEGLFGPEGKS